MTPLMIEMLINYHCKGDGHILNGSPAEQEAFEYFRTNGFIECSGDEHYKGTDKTRAYIEALCNIPEPVREWIVVANITDH